MAERRNNDCNGNGKAEYVDTIWCKNTVLHTSNKGECRFLCIDFTIECMQANELDNYVTIKYVNSCDMLVNIKKLP